ncbi:MAG: hypothetical protein ACP5VN_01215 [Acidobacteriota bacterium]
MLFLKCKRCGQWVCKEICWNAERSLCKNCAPILQRELAARQAAIQVDQAEEKLRGMDLTEGVDLQSTAATLCPMGGRGPGRGILPRMRPEAPMRGSCRLRVRAVHASFETWKERLGL